MIADSADRDCIRFDSYNRSGFAHRHLYLYIALTLVLILIAGLRTGGQGSDYASYQTLYIQNLTPDEYLANPIVLFFKDPGYFFLTSLLHYALGVSFEIFIFVFACVFVSLKMRAIARLSNAPMYSLVIYVSFFFIMQEMVTMRAGAAAAFFLSGIPALVNRRYLTYIVIIILAMCFHYSAIILLPLVFLSNKNEHPMYYLTFLLAAVIGASLGITIDSILLFLPKNPFSASLAYSLFETQSMSFVLNIFTRLSVPNLALCIVLLINFNKLKNANYYASYIIRIFVLSQILFYCLSGFPVLAIRLSELMGIVGILAWPLLLYLIRSSWLRVTIFACVSVIFLTLGLRELIVAPTLRENPMNVILRR
jgi:hypothetical protein